MRSVAGRVAEGAGLEFVDVEMKRGGKGPVVRIFLDKPGRISLDELENASREISAILDVEDPIRRSYTLEVSSPGMTRPLKSARDFERVLEKNVHVAWSEAPGGEGAPIREIRGRLVSVNGDGIVVAPRDAKGREGVPVTVPLQALRHAQREISFR